MSEHYFAHGKLLLAGEYVVLKGATALAIPTCYGQHLEVEKREENNILWESFDHEDNKWFYACLDLNLNTLETDSPEKATYLQQLLRIGYEFSKASPSPSKVATRLDFPNDWGLGSSSTLVHLVAQWLKIDPIKLFFATSTGSGYDVACAGETQPILYHVNNRIADWENVELSSAFKEAYFIHLNKKQLSKPEVQRFLKLKIDSKEITELSTISSKMVKAITRENLMLLIDEHELKLSKLLSISPVKTLHFSDYDGSIKSLGAWGGDFIIAIGNNTPEYFKNKGYNTIIPFSKIIA